MVNLRGITWDHPRGYRGLEQATAAFTTLRPDITVHWDRHSLHHFEFHPVDDLVDDYDLIVLDHPSIGAAAESGCLLDLNAYSTQLELDYLAGDIVGRSLETYWYNEGLWALPLDAACQVAVLRPDLLDKIGLPVPRTLDDVRELARHTRIGIGYKGVHSLMVFFTLCANLGDPLFSNLERPNQVVARQTGLRALEIMREILDWCPPEVLEWNSIGLLNAMRDRADIAYCPYVFGFANYGLAGPGQLGFSNIPGVESNTARGSILGGTGLAVSHKCAHPEAALAVAGFVLGREVQIAMTLQHGQPARRSAWLDATVNATFNGFYQRTLATIEQAYVRPRHPGYLTWQWEAGQAMEQFLREPGDPHALLDTLDALYLQARRQR